MYILQTKKVILFSTVLLLTTSVSGQNTKTLSLDEDTLMLDEVVVNSKMIRREAGMDIVNVVPIRKGKLNLLDLLHSVPGIVVEKDNISISGKGSVKVMFNGRLKKVSSDELMSLLRGYRADNVTAVEIIKEPGAKYEAEGNFGLLNIVTEKRQNVVNIGLSDELSMAHYWGNDAGMDFSHNYRRWTSSVHAGWTYKKNYYEESSHDFYSDFTRVQHTTLRPRDNKYNFSAAVDCQIDSLTLIGIEASYANQHQRRTDPSAVETFSTAGSSLISSQSATRLVNDGNDLNVSLYFNHKWRKKDFTLMADAFQYKRDKDYDFSSLYYMQGSPIDSTDYSKNAGYSHLKGVSVALDYETVFADEWILSLGTKGSWSRTDNNNTYDVCTLPFQNAQFQYYENIYAVYATLRKSFEKLSFNAGLRYEFTDTKNKGDKTEQKHYGRLFPNLSLLYQLSEKQSIETSIGSGINRPSIRTVNPFSIYSNPYTVVKGNPAIEPSYWYNLRVTHILSFKGGEFSTELRGFVTSQETAQITDLDDAQGIMTSQWRNAYKSRGLCMTNSLYLMPCRWMTAYLLNEVGYTKTVSDYGYAMPDKSYWGEFLYANLRFVFDKHNKWTSLITGTYSSKTKNVTGVTNASYNLGVGLNYSISSKWNVKASLENLLASHVKGVSYSSETQRMKFDNNYSPLTFVIGFSCNFGSDIRVKNKQHSNNDIKRRF